MKYLLDANVLINAKRTGYHFEICPGFWTWIERRSAAGAIFSVSNVATEVKEGKDELSKWATGAGKHLFIATTNPSTFGRMPEVSDWVMSQSFAESSRFQFFSKADPFIVAHALAHGFTVVTLETKHSDKNQVKIPHVCEALKVPWMTPWDMMKNERVRFILDEEQEEMMDSFR